jgi:hypothetical protein
MSTVVRSFGPSCSLFGWLGADVWCWFVLREEYCWLVAGGWFVVREKYCWLVADKPSEQTFNPTVFFFSNMQLFFPLFNTHENCISIY